MANSGLKCVCVPAMRSRTSSTATAAAPASADHGIIRCNNRLLKDAGGAGGLVLSRVHSYHHRFATRIELSSFPA